MIRQLINSSGGKGRQGFSKTRLIQLDDIPPVYGTPGQILAMKVDQSGFEYIDLSPISRGANITNPDGITEAQTVVVWKAPYACEVVGISAFRIGGTGATINARSNGTSLHLATAFSLTSADTWMSPETLQNIEYVINDYLEVMIVSVAGDPTSIIIQVDFQRTFA